MEGHRLRVGALAWSSSLLSSGGRDKTIFQRDIRAQDDFVSKLSGHKSEVRFINFLVLLVYFPGQSKRFVLFFLIYIYIYSFCTSLSILSYFRCSFFNFLECINIAICISAASLILIIILGSLIFYQYLVVFPV